MNRQLTDAARPRDRLLAARVVVAEEHVSECMPTFDAGKKCMYERTGLFDQLRDGEGAPGDEHHDHGLAGGDQRIDERLLAAGEIEMRTVLRFAALGFALAHHRNDEVDVVRLSHGSGNALIVAIDGLAFAVDLRTLRIADHGGALARRSALANAGEHAHHILRLAARMPRAEQVFARIGEWAGHEDALR